MILDKIRDLENRQKPLVPEAGGEKLNIIIRKREGVVFSGPVNAVTSTNEVGEFDILGNHTSFITGISNNLRLYITEDITKEFEFDKGLLHVDRNKVNIFLGI